MTSGAKGFVPPPYPYERLSTIAELARASRNGLIDCSIGTPCDPPIAEVVEALGSSGAERGYPPSAGTPAYLDAVIDYLDDRFSVELERGQVTACIGTKEVVASTAHFLSLRDPSKDTVLYPSVSYPTYAMSATLAGLRSVPVPPAHRDGHGVTLDAISEEDAKRAVMLWVNSPANPSGGLTDLARAAQWGRSHGVPLFSDECYAEFTWSGPPQTILTSGVDGVVAVHSLSKRSNLAGVRAGFLAGDGDLISYLKSVRQHGGLMVPGPVQAAAIVAYGDSDHVDLQRDRYQERMAILAHALSDAGIETHLPEGGFYLWVRAPERFTDGWALAASLATHSGVLASPGEFYGTDAAQFLRIALVQPTQKIKAAAQALAEVEFLV
jgi:succinyldiaminopimelate transaminase